MQFALFNGHSFPPDPHLGSPPQHRSNDFKEVEKCLPADVVLPVLSTLTLTLPPDGPPVSDSSHVPFPTKVTMTGVRDGIDLLQSLMRPKKIRVLGSDGNEYAFLAKPKDDLRKDTRWVAVTHRWCQGRWIQCVAGALRPSHNLCTDSR